MNYSNGISTNRLKLTEPWVMRHRLLSRFKNSTTPPQVLRNPKLNNPKFCLSCCIKGRVSEFCRDYNISRLIKRQNSKVASLFPKKGLIIEVQYYPAMTIHTWSLGISLGFRESAMAVVQVRTSRAEWLWHALGTRRRKLEVQQQEALGSQVRGKHCFYSWTSQCAGLCNLNLSVQSALVILATVLTSHCHYALHAFCACFHFQSTFWKLRP